MSGRNELTLSLPPEVEAWLAARVAAGGHGDASAIVAAALRQLAAAETPLAAPADPAADALVAPVAEADPAAMQAALRDSEQRYRTLFDACPFAILILDPATHRLLDVNAQACINYGYTREEFLQLRIGDIDALRDPAAIRARGRAGTMRPGLQQFEAVHRTRDGTLRDVLVRVQGVQLAGRDVTYGVHVDITDRKAAEAALQASDARLRLALEAARLGTWEFDLAAGTGQRAGPLAEALPHVPPTGFGLLEWLEPLHPDDRPAVRRRFEAIAAGEAARFAAEFRVRRPGGGWMWVSSFGAVVERAADGTVRRIAGVAQDCTDRKQAEERQALLTREVDHRAKNALAVVQAALRLTRAESVTAYRHAVEGRVAALARAQTLLAEDHWTGADLRALLTGEVQPFLSGAAGSAPGQDGHRLSLDGPPVLLPAAAAQPLAMAIHELATNATKHGALSRSGGAIAIAWQVSPARQQQLRLVWRESGGPPLLAAPARRGFGGRVLEATLRGQLGGSVSCDWQPAGLVCTLDLPLQRAAPANPPVEDESAAQASIGRVT